jgi:hypothetical protein
MPTKKKQNKKTPIKKLGRDPTLKPTVVDTTHMASKEEQADNPLNRMRMVPDMTKDAPLPEGFKTADSVTEVDDLKFEMGRLRELLVSWLDRRQINGVWYQVLVDPMNRNIEISIEK